MFTAMGRFDGFKGLLQNVVQHCHKVVSSKIKAAEVVDVQTLYH